jgi:hypothetical protein
MRSSVYSFLLAIPLFACTQSAVEETPLGDVLDDSKADSWGYPTNFGTLYTDTWQYGLLEPSSKLRTPAWTFFTNGSAHVTIESHQAPTDEPWLTGAVVYLYKQRDVGTWQRIAKSGIGGFGSLTRDLEAGAYRVIVKGLGNDDEGEFMVRLGCEGAGCVTDSCLFGDSFYELRQLMHGATSTYKAGVLTAASQLTAAQQAQIVAAVQVSALGEDVTTVAEAFAAVDQNEVNQFNVYDSLAGRAFTAFEYGAGDSSYGAFFEGDAPARVAEIGDGEIRECTAQAKSCVLGRSYHEAKYMPDLKQVSTRWITKATQVNRPFLKDQIIAAVNEASYEVSTLAEAFESVDQGEIRYDVYRHTDGREFVAIEYGAGDNSYGAFFAAGSTTMVASIHDGDLYGCTAW